jgi:RAT1-interacting protein
VIYIEEPLSEKRERPTRGPPDPRQKLMCYWGYRFETACTIDRTKKSYSTDALQKEMLAREKDPRVDTHVQFCSVVKTKLGKVWMATFIETLGLHVVIEPNHFGG